MVQLDNSFGSLITSGYMEGFNMGENKLVTYQSKSS